MSGTDQETPTETGAHTTSEEAPNHGMSHQVLFLACTHAHTHTHMCVICIPLSRKSDLESTFMLCFALVLAANEHLEKLRKQIEFYFSRENLAKDQFLISQMTTMDLYVPLSIIASVSGLSEFNRNLVVLGKVMWCYSLLVDAVFQGKSISLAYEQSSGFY